MKNPAQQHFADAIVDVLKRAIQAIEQSDEFYGSHAGLIAQQLDVEVIHYMAALFGEDREFFVEAAMDVFARGYCGDYDGCYPEFEAILEGKPAPEIPADPQAVADRLGEAIDRLKAAHSVLCGE